MRRPERFALLVVLAFVATRCASTTDSGSQTHWMSPCATNADCGTGLGCTCGLCSKTCASAADCNGLGRTALCVTTTSAAHTSVCGGADGPALCLPTCDGGCRTDERCVDGACVPGSSTHADASSGGSGNGGTGGTTSSNGGTEAGTGGTISSGGAGVAEAGPIEGGACTNFQVLVYPSPGCDGTVTPVCEGPAFDACAGWVCGCDGVTLSGCGNWRKPWRSLGPCPQTLCVTYVGDASQVDGGSPSPGCSEYTGFCNGEASPECPCLLAEYPVGCTCTQPKWAELDIQCPAP